MKQFRDANLDRSFGSMKPESEGPGFHWQEREGEQLVVVELDSTLNEAHVAAAKETTGVVIETGSGSFVLVKITVICMYNTAYRFVTMRFGRV